MDTDLDFWLNLLDEKYLIKEIYSYLPKELSMTIQGEKCRCEMTLIVGYYVKEKDVSYKIEERETDASIFLDRGKFDYDKVVRFRFYLNGLIVADETGHTYYGAEFI